MSAQPSSSAPRRVNAIRSILARGRVYLRQEDVVEYLRDTANDWAAQGDECNVAAAGSLTLLAAKLDDVGKP